ncbi:choline O-acetyltransferase-like [Tubulanus polymorphus]|uniref:choline O-acetyltransferase-like n=1 Tax=Tubulanus polymorphus TaxID=672921 RepID=UPI003DA5734B
MDLLHVDIQKLFLNEINRKEVSQGILGSALGIAARIIHQLVGLQQLLNRDVAPKRVHGGLVVPNTGLYAGDTPYTYLTPHRGYDELVPHTKHIATGSEYLIIACQNQFFKLPVMERHQLLTEGQLRAQLDNICKRAQAENGLDPDVGILPTLPRDQWADVYSQLNTDATNRRSIYAIKEAMLMVCLDIGRDLPYSGDNAHRQTWFGHSSRTYAANRWSDKIMQIVIGMNGTTGLSLDTPYGEYMRLSRFMEQTYEALASSGEHEGFVHDDNHLASQDAVMFQKLVKDGTIKYLPEDARVAEVEKLKWNLDDSMRQKINETKEYFDKMIEEHLCVDAPIANQNIGRKLVKNLGMSPHAFFTMALSLASKRVFGEMVPMYTYAKPMNLDNMHYHNFSHQETKDWVDSMDDSNITDGERYALIKKANDKNQATLRMVSIVI